MLLTKKSGPSRGEASSSFVHSLRRGLSQALPTLDRRSFLRGTAVGATGFALTRLGIRAGGAEETAKAYGPFKMGIQSYSRIGKTFC